MSISSEIERIQNAKNSLKSSINAKTDSTHQITNETIDEYANFVDSISTGGGGSILITKKITTNGTYNAKDDNADGYSSVEVETSGVDINDYFDNYARRNTPTIAEFIKKTPLLDFTNARYLQNTFNNCTQLEEVNIVSNSTNRVGNMYGAFGYCTSLKELPFFNTENVTTMSNAFVSCSKIKSVPQYNTSNVSNFQSAFNNCTLLENVPILNTSSVKNIGNMFNNCPNLTDDSLDNILQMCIGATSYTGTKTLAIAGFNSTNYPTSRIEALPHYQDFINAGWTIGY